MSPEYNEMEALVRAARAAQVEARLLMECVQRHIIQLNENQWDDGAVEEARRVRRLTTLGINLPGIEVIFHMRRQLISYQDEIDQLRAEMQRVRESHEHEMRRLLRQLSSDF